MTKFLFTGSTAKRAPVLSRLFATVTPFRLFSYFAIATLFLFAGSNADAQINDEQKAAAYRKTITERSAKIVMTLEINDSDKYCKVVNEITNQYFSLNSIHEQHKAVLASIAGQSLEKSQSDRAIQSEGEKKAELLKQQHSAFITHLKKLLTDGQIEKVKDAMTYNILNVTYSAYLDMLQNLTTEQKQKIYNWLTEARELAMDEGSSDDKHKMFGKFKGRINNYLSAEGYDLKKETEAWQKRLKEKRTH